MAEYLSFGEDDLKEVPIFLLPTTRMDTVNGVEKPVPIEYMAEIISFKEVQSKAGDPQAKVVFAIPQPPPSMERTQIMMYLPFSRGKNFQLQRLCKVLGLKPPLTEDDFLGKKLIVTVKHETYATKDEDPDTGKKIEKTDNKIAGLIRLPNEAELLATKSDADKDLPF